jgi:hypothetical protein
LHSTEVKRELDAELPAAQAVNTRVMIASL